MADKKKTDVLKIFISSAAATLAVLLLWMLKNQRFREIPHVILLGCIAAFVLEMLICLIFRGKSTIVRAVKVMLVFAVNVSVFFSVIAYSFAPAIILQPHSDEQNYNALSDIPQVEEMIIEGTDGDIYGWYYDIYGENAPVMLYFYGNYETASTAMMRFYKGYSSSAFNGFNIAVFDYPAYGKSAGRCTDDSLLRFALDVYDKLSVRNRNIIVSGYSVGTGPAVYLASQRDVMGLVLYAPYADGTDLYNNVVDIFHGTLQKLVAFNIESVKYAADVEENVLIIASENDAVVPFSSSERLSQQFANARFYGLASEGHNDFFASTVVKEKTADFLREVAVL